MAKTAQTKQFKAESQRLLEMMIHSIYTHKEIFLRELISNASDAIDKLYFRSLSDETVGKTREDYFIRVDIDKEARTLTVTDNGCGMTEEELESNLGTIAQSGSLAFKKENQLDEDVDIIGQFGVGFYSAFMVAKKVTVESRAYGAEKAYRWESEGTEGYTIEECERDETGTKIVLHIMDNTEEENYDEFLETYRIQGIIRKYSDYIRYPILMDVEHSKLKEGAEGKEDSDYETEIVTETINSMVPIWKKNKDEVTEAEYNQFYKDKFYDYEDPLKVITSKTEGSATYNALLYIPGKAPYNYYSKEFEKGLQLYSNGVLIMDKCADLLPDYFSFVRGLVDSQDLSLNISRELLQHDRQLKIIAKSVEKKIKTELSKMLKNEREKYETFYKAFGLQLKFGVYQGYGMNKDVLQDLLLFTSSEKDENGKNKLVTLKEYVERMKPDQKYIFFASGESLQKVENLPQTEMVREKGFEILYFTDEVDEFAIQMLHSYEEKEFKSVAAGDLDLETEEEKEAAKKQSEESKDLVAFMKDALGDKVSAVRLSTRLKSHPVCFSADGQVSLEMERVLGSMPNADGSVKAQKVLEINASHPIFEKLKALFENDKETLKTYTQLLYNEAALMEGVPVDDPVTFANQICALMV